MNSLNVEQLIGSVIRGALGGRRKRHKGVARYLTGGRSSFLNASTLLALGGVAWGLYETMAQSGSSPGPAAGSAPPAAPRPAASAPVVPPPLPGSAPAAAPVVPPPLPGAMPAAVGPSVASAASAAGLSPEVLRVLRLTLSAARADGTLTPHEREAILAQARAAGAEPLIAAELDAPTPLEAIVGRAPGGRVAEDLYTLAFSIVRADERVLDGERQYLDALAGHLGLDAAVVARLEEQAASRIAEAWRE